MTLERQAYNRYLEEFEQQKRAGTVSPTAKPLTFFQVFDYDEAPTLSEKLKEQMTRRSNQKRGE